MNKDLFNEISNAVGKSVYLYLESGAIIESVIKKANRKIIHLSNVHSSGTGKIGSRDLYNSYYVLSKEVIALRIIE